MVCGVLDLAIVTACQWILHVLGYNKPWNCLPCVCLLNEVQWRRKNLTVVWKNAFILSRACLWTFHNLIQLYFKSSTLISSICARVYAPLTMLTFWIYIYHTHDTVTQGRESRMQQPDKHYQPLSPWPTPHKIHHVPSQACGEFVRWCKCDTQTHHPRDVFVCIITIRHKLTLLHRRVSVYLILISLSCTHVCNYFAPDTNFHVLP